MSPTGIAKTLMPALIATSLAAQTQYVATGEETWAAASRSGTYVDTWTPDGVYESFVELDSRGKKPSRRYSHLKEVWFFEVPAATAMTLYVKAYHTENNEGDDFVFRWLEESTQTWHDVLTVTKTSDDGLYDSGPIPASASGGTITIFMRDTDWTANNRFYDTVYVDHLYIEATVGGGGGPPAAPSDLQGKSMSENGAFFVWTDNSGDEDGFRIERSLDGSSWITAGTVDPDVESFTDEGASPATTYHYQVIAYKGEEDSAASNIVSLTTLPAGSYTVEPVAPTGQDSHAHAHSPSGVIGVGYQGNDGQAYFAERDPSTPTWSNEVVGPGGYGIDVAYTPDDRPSMSIGGVAGLYFAERHTSSGWHVEMIDGYNCSADDTSLAYDPTTGEPVISYRRRSGRKRETGLRVARRTNGTWSTELVDQGNTRYSSLAFDWNDNPVIAYSGSEWDTVNMLKLARWNVSTLSWDIEVLEEGATGFGVDASLAIDPTSGLLAVVHSYSGETRVLRSDGGPWQLEVFPNCHRAEIAFTPSGDLMIGYYDDLYSNGDVYLKYETSTGWVDEFVFDKVHFAWPLRMRMSPMGQATFTFRGGLFGTQYVEYAH